VGDYVTSKNIMQQLSTEDIIKIVENLGGHLYKINGNYMIFNSICCKPEKNKLYYYFDSERFYCYLNTCSCHYTIISLVQKVKGINYYDAVNYISSIIGRNIEEQTSQIIIKKIKDWEWINKFTKKEKITQKNEVLSEDILKQYIYAPVYKWVKEGISVPSQYKFGIRYDLESNRIILPKRNEKGELIGVTGRTLEVEYEELDIPKYFSLYSYQKSLELYGLWITKDAIRKKRKVVIFESEKSVLKCDTYYGNDNFTVGVEGSNISEEQKKLILKQDVGEVFLAFDKEYKTIYSQEYKNYLNNLLKIARDFYYYTKVYLILDRKGVLGYKDSPADRGRETLEYLMKNKIEVTKNMLTNIK
jgi:hypothetical protein